GRRCTRSRAVRASSPPALRPVCEVRRWNREGRRRTRPQLRWFSREAWPGSHQGTTHPLGRAAVGRRKASRPRWDGAAPRWVRRTTLRFPAFRFLLLLLAKREDEETKPEDTHPRGSFPPPVSRFTRPRSEAPGRKPRRRTERFVRYSPSPGWEGSRAHKRVYARLRRAMARGVGCVTSPPLGEVKRKVASLFDKLIGNLHPPPLS